MPEFILPGKAFEVLQEIGNDKQKKLLKKGEKRNKGRGYRVFISMTYVQAQHLGDLLAEHVLESPTANERTACSTAVERLGGTFLTEPTKRQDPDEFQTYGAKLADATPVLSLLSEDDVRQMHYIEGVFSGKHGQRELADFTMLRDRYRDIIRSARRNFAEQSQSVSA